MIRHPNIRRTLWAMPIVCLSASLGAQQQPVGDNPSQSKQAVSAIDLGDPVTSNGDEVSDPIWGGEPNTVLQTDLSDAVPAPDPAFVEIGAAGDRVVKPAGGNPYFLGFASGRYYPPADEKIDPALNQVLQAQFGDGRIEQQTYVFVMFNKRITSERIAAIEATGARVFGYHPHYTLKVAAGVTQIDEIAASDFVRWVGLPRTWQKIHPSFQAAADQIGDGEQMEAWVSVHDSDLGPQSVERVVGQVEEGGPNGTRILDVEEAKAILPREFDSNGWQQRELERLGVTALQFDPDIRAFRVRLSPSVVQDLAKLDFVLFIEPRGIPSLAHDESMPLINADYTRVPYDGNANLAAVAGQADSGLDYDHSGLTGFYWWSTNLTGTSESPVDDLCGHGSHVAGTIQGNTTVEDSYEGAANALGWGANGRYFNTKIFYGAGCLWGGTTMGAILGAMDNSVTDTGGFTTVRPHVINHSWGTTSAGSPIGSEADCRTIDSSVYTNQQLHVWASGNEGPSSGSLRIEPSSKNVLTVGNVTDTYVVPNLPGTLNSSSSRGPCGDGRWKPNVVAPGTNIFSIDAHTGTGYTNYTGTSMATPHVTGLVSQLVDHIPFLRHNPATTSALLMATAITKDGQTLSTPADAHLDTYGAGRVESYKAHYGSSNQALYYWGFTLGSGASTNVDFTVDPGATRVVAVMHYIEPASSAGASKALVNDLDMYLDQNPISAGNNTGEWVAQQSSLDNTEIRILDNPVTGPWKLKVYPAATVNTSYVGLSVSVIYGDVTPNPTMAVTASDQFVKPLDNVVISADYTNPAYIASAVILDPGFGTGSNLLASTGVLADGSTANYINNEWNGDIVTIGNLRHGSTRGVDWTVEWSTEGIKGVGVLGVSENADPKSASVTVTVDGTPPNAITGLFSPTHTVNVVSCQSNVTLNWFPATDNLSGVDGLSYLWNQSASSTPDTVSDLAGNATSLGVVMGATPGGWYFHLRAIDKSGNAGPTAHIGPFLYNANAISTYCTALVSSGGCNPAMGSSGVPSLANPGGFSVRGVNLESNQNGLMFFGTTGQNSAPFFGGTLCVSAPLHRMAIKNSLGGAACTGLIQYTLAEMLANATGGGLLTSGTSVDCQVWFRDPPASQTVGLTNGLEFLVCP